MDLLKERSRAAQSDTSPNTRAKQAGRYLGKVLECTVCRDCRRVIALCFPSGVPLDTYGLPLVSAMGQGLSLKIKSNYPCAACVEDGRGYKLANSSNHPSSSSGSVA